jgi:predicted anti-sigma-YlaC factor YlaD
MNTCKKISEQLLDFYFKDVDNAAIQEIETHLQQCAECSKAYQKIEAALNAKNLLNENKPSEFLHTRVMAQLEQVEENNSIFTVFQPVLKYATFIVIIVAGIGTGLLFSNRITGYNNSVAQSTETVASTANQELLLASGNNELSEISIYNNK